MAEIDVVTPFTDTEIENIIQSFLNKQKSNIENPEYFKDLIINLVNSIEKVYGNPILDTFDSEDNLKDACLLKLLENINQFRTNNSLFGERGQSIFDQEQTLGLYNPNYKSVTFYKERIKEYILDIARQRLPEHEYDYIEGDFNSTLNLPEATLMLKNNFDHVNDHELLHALKMHGLKLDIFKSQASSFYLNDGSRTITLQGAYEKFDEVINEHHAAALNRNAKQKFGEPVIQEFNFGNNSYKYITLNSINGFPKNYKEFYQNADGTPRTININYRSADNLIGLLERVVGKTELFTGICFDISNFSVSFNEKYKNCFKKYESLIFATSPLLHNYSMPIFKQEPRPLDYLSILVAECFNGDGSIAYQELAQCILMDCIEKNISEINVNEFSFEQLSLLQDKIVNGVCYDTYSLLTLPLKVEDRKYSVVQDKYYELRDLCISKYYEIENYKLRMNSQNAENSNQME
ncbi:MAG: hypothetical protein WCX32_03565 [Clostridia bacterium]|jgi:hypothetical protein|nr:hypothetical protein [Clostridia bacterium]